MDRLLIDKMPKYTCSINKVLKSVKMWQLFKETQYNHIDCPTIDSIGWKMQETSSRLVDYSLAFPTAFCIIQWIVRSMLFDRSGFIRCHLNVMHPPVDHLLDYHSIAEKWWDNTHKTEWICRSMQFFTKRMSASRVANEGNIRCSSVSWGFFVCLFSRFTHIRCSQSATCIGISFIFKYS